MSEYYFIRICDYFQYFVGVLINSKIEHEAMAYINAESIKKCSQFMNKVNVTKKLFIATALLSKYQSIVSTKIMLKRLSKKIFTSS